jgi:DNA-binding transcriptional MerR regulator
MRDPEIKVGELARRAGVTVRTLHHWEEMGIVHPCRRTAAGHRVYGESAVRRLLVVRSLRALGLGLDAIREALDSGNATLQQVLRAHKARIRSQMKLLRGLEDRLERILRHIDNGEELLGGELLQTMEMMTMIEKHFTPEQLEALAARREALGADAIREAEEEWPRLIAQVREEMQKGTDPASPVVQELAARWKALVQAFSGGDIGIESSLGKMFKAEPQMAADQGLDPEIFQYVGRALRAGS